ncbi:JAB domain-containing protein [Tenacibaculum sp. ZS6-P6]|uniref:JAB domain-containing protein n=1 Tax=Tenacibaculum sp. ZS6-P6 TaxID=3447503 RepID=UPI003F9C63C5
MTKRKSNIEHVKLVYRNKIKASDRPKVACNRDAYKIFREDWDDDTINLVEEFKLMALDRNLRVMSIATISKGGMSGTLVDLKILFATALLRRANRIIIAHNHPSGNTKPSRQDIALTEKIKKAGEILDLPLDDHIIVTDSAYGSMNEQGFI